jgi:two-component system sensor histidine kinase HydH
MRTGIRRLDAIVTELLDFSRPMRLDLAPVDVNGVLAEVARRVVAADATLRLDLAEGLPEVRADGYKVRQVFENLLRNALDALPAAGRGPREIDVSTRPGQGAFAGGVAAEIRDTGRGIAPADLERIWEPFFTSKTHGSGLGLAVVRRIVEAHRGEVRVESEPGRGTAFTMSLRADPQG